MSQFWPVRQHERVQEIFLGKLCFPDKRNKHLIPPFSPILPTLNTAMMYGILAANLLPRGRIQENYRDANTKVINQPAATCFQSF